MVTQEAQIRNNQHTLTLGSQRGIDFSQPRCVRFELFAESKGVGSLISKSLTEHGFALVSSVEQSGREPEDSPSFTYTFEKVILLEESSINAATSMVLEQCEKHRARFYQWSLKLTSRDGMIDPQTPLLDVELAVAASKLIDVLEAMHQRNPEFDLPKKLDFDYSGDSLQILSKLILKVRRLKGFDDKALFFPFVLSAGAYVGEVIRKLAKNREWHWIGYHKASELDTYTKQLGHRYGTFAVLCGGKEIIRYPLLRVEGSAVATSGPTSVWPIVELEDYYLKSGPNTLPSLSDCDWSCPITPSVLSVDLTRRIFGDSLLAACNLG